MPWQQHLRRWWREFLLNCRIVWQFFATGRCFTVVKEKWQLWKDGDYHNDKISDALLIPFHDIQVGKKIGEGGYGIVYQGSYRREKVAVKKVKNQQIGEKAIRDLLKEGKVHARLRSKYVVQLLGVCIERNNVCLIVEWMDKGNLRSILHNPKEVLPWSLRISILHQIALGMNALHGCRPSILHQDLKSGNVLIDRHWQAKLCDFGISSALVERQSVPSDSTSKPEELHGTVQWTAPELFLRFDCHHTKETDVYSFAILMWEIANRQDPYWNMALSSISVYVIKGGRPTGILPPDTPTDWIKLMQDSWSQLPLNRPSFETIISRIEDFTTEAEITNPVHIENFAKGLEKLALYQFDAANELFIASIEQNGSFSAARLGLCLSYELHPFVAPSHGSNLNITFSSLSCDKFLTQHMIHQAQVSGTNAGQESLKILLQIANNEYGTTATTPGLLNWILKPDTRSKQHLFAWHLIGMLKEHVLFDAKGAFEWYEKAAEEYFRPSLAALSVMYLEGKGRPRDLNRARELANKSVDSASTYEPERPTGSCWLAKGAVVEAFSTATSVVEILGNIESPTSTENSTSATQSPQTSKSLIEAYEAFLRGAQLQWAPCEFRVGVCLEYGRGIAIDSNQAFVYYLRSARKGYAEAQLRAGRFLVKRSQHSSVQGLTLTGQSHIPMNGASMSAVSPQATGSAASASHKGAGHSTNATPSRSQNTPSHPTILQATAQYAGAAGTLPETPALFLRRAAEQGCASAWAFLAEMYEQGSGGVPKDLAEAQRLYKKAAQGGSVLGQRATRRLSDSQRPFWAIWS